MIHERYEVVRTDDGWVALAHCDCGTTRQSLPRENPAQAVTEARHAVTRHINKERTEKCGTENYSAIECACDQCKTHNRDLAKLVGL